MTRSHFIGTFVALMAIGASGARADSLVFVDSFFDVFIDTTSGPPYPSDPPIVVHVQNDAATGTFDTEIVSLSLSSVNPPQMPVQVIASDSGGGQGTGGKDSFFDVFVEVSPNNFPAESFFDVFVDVDPPSTSLAPRDLIAAPRVVFTDSFFEVFFDITVTDVDRRADRQTHHLQGVIGDGLRFKNVGLGGPGPAAPGADSFFDVFVEIDLPGLTPPDLSNPVFSMTLNGRLVPEPASCGPCCFARRCWRAAKLGQTVDCADDRAGREVRADLVERDIATDLGVALESRTQRLNRLDLGFDQVARQAVCGDPHGQHACGDRFHFEDDRLHTQQCQAALWIFEQLDRLRGRLIQRVGRLTHLQEKLTLVQQPRNSDTFDDSKKSTKQAEFEWWGCTETFGLLH